MANIDQLWQRFLILTSREKIMAVASLLLLVWGAWDMFFFQPMQSRNQDLVTEIVKNEQQVVGLQQVVKQFEVAGQNNPNAASRQHLTQLQQSVNRLKQQLYAGTKKFVSADLMANALADLLKQQGNLKLVKLETLPVTDFGKTEEQAAKIYRHSLEITIQGDYFSTLEYLKSLETLSWKIHWHSMAYHVIDYPVAETRIQVFTLSFEKDWLSV